jgi:hypothetical protein
LGKFFRTAGSQIRWHSDHWHSHELLDGTPRSASYMCNIAIGGRATRRQQMTARLASG